MSKITSIFIILSLFIFTSCAMKNSDSVTVTITSNPPNTNLYINNRYYGQTPKTISLVPTSKVNYIATIEKDGYSKSKKLETYNSIREGRGVETFRCATSALFMAISVKCRDFKQKEYFIDLYK